MSRAEILSTPVGEMLDMMACMAIDHGARQKSYADMDDLAAIE